MVPSSATRTCCAILALVSVGLACRSLPPRETRDPAVGRALARVKLFSVLTDAERGEVASTAALRRGKAGERIIEQGKRLDSMYVVLEGKAEVRVNGKRVTTLSMTPLVGEMEFLDGHAASADVILLQDTDLVELNNASLTALMERRPRLGYALMREIARTEALRLRETASK